MDETRAIPDGLGGDVDVVEESPPNRVVSALSSGLVKKEHNPIAESIEEDEEEDAPLSPKHHMAKFENQWEVKLNKMMQSKDKRAEAKLKKHRDALGLDDGVELKVFA